jgi:hypothetical protein
VIYTGLKYQGKTLLDYQYTLQKKKRRASGKNRSFFWGWVLVEDGGHKEKGTEGEYCGYNLYSYMQIEE